MNTFKTRDLARNFARNVNAVAPAKLKAPVKNDAGEWEIPGISHADKLGTLSRK
ncbi:hypothetical protein [Citrobacter phage Tr1]|nr:hypothetical protein [Citrobacter phage Tr1]